MPTRENLLTCICCGRPSPTVVCMQCYFDYDHRTANNRELEKPRRKKAKDVIQEEENYVSLWEQEPEAFQIPPVKETKEPQSQEPPSVSWFSRLPRFS